jgi:perosamine synthetase
MSAESLDQVISPKTKAVIFVDIYGNMPDVDSIREVARRRGIAVVEDAAEAIGAEYKGRKAGSFGDTSVFSFHGTKTLTTGEGGLLATDREDVYRKSLVLRDHGRELGGKLFWHTEVAYKYKMSNMQAALGLAQLERIDELVERKRQIFKWYHSELCDAPGVTMNYQAPSTKSSYWMVTVVVGAEFGLEKEEIMKAMLSKGIHCRPFFYPLSSLPAYEGLEQAQEARRRNKSAYAISPYGLNLPCAMNITREQVRYVCDALKSILDMKKA